MIRTRCSILEHYADRGTKQAQGRRQPRLRTYRDEEHHYGFIFHYTRKHLQPRSAGPGMAGAFHWRALSCRAVAFAFQLLRSNDLIWSRVIHEYLLGQPESLSDLMAWNADTTRLPYRMHAEYLRSLFLDNDLFEGRYRVDDRPITLNDIRVPIFAVGTIRDHVAPWRSVYKISLLTDTDVTFLLTSGGHNAGIVSEPGHPHRSYQYSTRLADEPYIDPDTWQAAMPVQEGSWWPTWQAWLAKRSSGRVAPPCLGMPTCGYPQLADAPGTYVLQP